MEPETSPLPVGSIRPGFSTQFTILIVLVLALVVFQGWQVFGGTSTATQRWEYTIEAPRDEQLAERLRVLGLAGWEIVSARRAVSEEDGKTAGTYEMILRRPAQQDVSRLPVPPHP